MRFLLVLLATPALALPPYVVPPAVQTGSGVTSVNNQTGAVTLTLPTQYTDAMAAAASPVRSVNGQTGAVSLSIPSITGLATTASVTSALSAYTPTSGIAALSPVQSVNGLTGAVAVPVYTDAQALAANASAITSAVAPLATTATLNTLAASVPQFINTGAYMTLATILASYPCASGYLGKLAHVSDLWGSAATTLVCESNGSTFYWRPQRTDYSSVLTQTSGSLTLTPLLTAPILYLSAAPTGNITVTLSPTNAWPGAQFHIYSPPALGIYTLTLSGLVGGGTLPMVQGADKIVTYTTSGWKSN